MQRYFALNKFDNIFELSDNDYHHIKTVMRMKENDVIEVVFKEKLYHANLDSKLKPILNSLICQKNHTFNVTIAPAIIKESNWNHLLQKATELNVKSIIPIKTNRSIINLTSDKKAKKQTRWQKIVKEASEQSKRLDIPPIFDIIDMEHINIKDYDLCLYGNPNSIKNLKQVIKGINNNTKVLFLSGPEGGLTNQEMALLDNQGFIGINLGNTVYRAETAPIAVLSMINYELME